ncbi:MAG: hypothetical protein JWQ39_2535 [Glaciihabitans sp.]|nr:hypothetical protein [Glaciihabitans sp.]
MRETELAPSTVGGYRLVRLLGAGSRADVYLGAGTLGSAAIKVFHPDILPGDFGRELDALGRVPRQHCVRLLDIATGPDGLPVPILERVHRGTLSFLLRERENIHPGEAVTLLAPLARTVAALHRSGVAHSRIGAGSVHLGSAGEPVLLRFGHCDLFESGSSIAALEANEAVHRDLGDLAALALLVLGATPHTTADTRVRTMLDWLSAPAMTLLPGFAAELEERLFDLAEPLPISFERAGLAVTGVPARLTPVQASYVTDAGAFASDLDRAPSTPVTEARSGALHGIVRHAILTSPVEAVRTRVLALVRGVRKPVWAVAGAIAVALTLAIAFVPQGGSSRATVVRAPPAGDPIPAAPIPTQSALPDDPVSALKLLLAARAACIRDRSVLCLDGVDEKSSGAFAGDAAIIESIQAGGELPADAVPAAASPKLIELLGDSALISLGAKSNPASALMIKDEAGWRIRSFLSGKPVTK